MELLYKYFIIQFWSFKYGQGNSNQTAFFNSIIWILVIFALTGLLFYVIYDNIILGNPRIQQPPRSRADGYMQTGTYLLIGYQILKWLIVKKMGFDIESGTSDRYDFVPTRRQRRINLIAYILFIVLLVTTLVFRSLYL